ncbi:MAG: hypothetical protein HUU46_20290 [Candidatus Hydrogenedentes bacterium]|nr:hypothetical protein [Candidatus Hydrogenedentota bacterium]
MAEWTPEAREYLDGYLQQVRALARGSGEDGEEIASGLREHVVEKAEREAGSLVTLEILRRSLAEVGSPEAILDEGQKWVEQSRADTNGEKSGAATTPAAVPAREPRSDRGLLRSMGCGCGMIGATAILAIAALGTYIFYARYDSFKKLQVVMAQDKAVQMLRTIAEAERKWREEGKHDNDGDGVPDYATLAELIEEKSIPEEYGRGAHGGYVLNIMVSNSSETAIWKPSKGADSKEPGYLCSARPLEGLDLDLKPLVITHEEVVRYEGAGGVGGKPYVSGVAESMSSTHASSKRKQDAILKLQRIAHWERTFLERGMFDPDNDGKQDYGDLQDLATTVADGNIDDQIEGFAFHIEVIQTSKGGPSFVCKAIPTDESISSEIITIEPDGVLRFLPKDKMKREQETQHAN